MAGAMAGGLWLLALLFGCGRLSAFNLDPDNVIRKNGEKGSFFGFSIALHRQLSPVDKRWLLVGAPKAKALSGQKSKVTGGLYGCDMSSPSTQCNRINFDNEENLAKESKENQWMGVSVNSQGPGGKIVTCAHRYQRRANVGTTRESRDIIGRCYVLSEDLSIDPAQAEDGGDWHFCESRNRGHEMFGSCQQGLAAMFDKDYHYIIFGAPGAYNWKGIVRLEQKNETLLDLGVYDDGPFEVGDESEKNPDLVPAPANSYLGFSLATGNRLTKKRGLIVVAGAPRANHSGAVVMLKTGGETSNILVEEHTLEGEGLASSFGYDLTVLDLNRDGWEDIVVGAPQYFEKDGEIGGAVYVYINKAGNWNKVKPFRIDGPLNSMFGLAVENLGDINQDNFDDFAVGAPYDEDGIGSVYIYHGSAEGITSKKAAQILSGSPLGVTLFGYSLAGNMDLDKNSYPDLAVGSLSDSVFVFRARPVINIKKEINFSPKEIDLTTKNCGNNFCVTVEACFSYSANPKSYAPRLTVAYSLEADADHRKNGLIPRATFTPVSGSDKNYESKGIINIDGKGKKQCITRQLAIQENIRDKLRGIPIDVSVAIQESKRKRRQSDTAQMAPVLDANEPATTREEVNFVKEGCGQDKICQSNLRVNYRYGHRSIDGNTFTPLQLENGVPVISLSNQKDIALEISVTNENGDDAHEAFVVASLPRTLTYATYRSPPNEKPVTCTANRNGSKAECDLGNPFKRDSKTTFYIIMSTARISPNTTDLQVDLHLETTSEQQNKGPIKAVAKVTIMLQLSLSGQAFPSQVYYTNNAKGGVQKSESDIGSAITHQFRIINLGKSLRDLGTATLEIDWPMKTSGNDGLLYLTKITSKGITREECTPKDEINNLKMELNSRKKRAAENTRGWGEGIISRLSEKNSKSLSCEDGATCMKIKCPLIGFDSNAVITLHSRLWNKTLSQHYSNYHHTEVIVKAVLYIESATKNTVLQNSNTKVKLSVFPDRREAQHGGVPWWIIVLSILFGLLLLALLAFLLWKCGFFERAKYEDNVPSYSAVRIKWEERAINSGNCDEANLRKKPWMATWHDNEHYS